MKLTRNLILGLLASVYALLLGVRVFTIQFNPDFIQIKNDQEKSSSAYVYELDTGRGLIYDRWGNLLATNRRVYEVGLNLSGSYNSTTVAQVASSLLGRDFNTVFDYVESHRVSKNGQGYYTLGRFVEKDTLDQILALAKQYSEDGIKGDSAPSLDGIDYAPMLIRAYPEGSLASNVLGYVDSRSTDHLIGNYGVEGRFDELLNPPKTGFYITGDPNQVKPPPDSSASNLVLTIDREIQATVEKILDQALEANGAQSGTILVADPKTGELLAVATSGRENANNITTNPSSQNPFFRAVGQTYEPGSVFKVVTMATAIDLGLVTPETTIYDSGLYTENGSWVQNWDRLGHGTVSMTKCMELSLNVCLATVANDMIGVDKFYEYLQRFGFLSSTGIDMAGESIFPPMLPNQSFKLADGTELTWSRVDMISQSFGQGLFVTVMQMIEAYTAFANDGMMMRPHVVKSVITNGEKYDTPITPISQPITAETARTITAMLAESLQGETSHVNVPGYKVAGKTGTGEIANGAQGYNSPLTNASFVGWGPADDPKLLIYVWFEKPTSSRWGSEVVAPVFGDVFLQTAVLLNIPPDETRQVLGNVNP